MMPYRLINSVALLFVYAFFSACGLRAEERKPCATHLVAMGDDIHLATDYYLPDEGEAPFPVVLVRSVYGRSWAWGDFASGFTGRGIALVVQDTRGRGDSKGKDMVFADDGWADRQDGLDTVQWIRKQPWCNGRIGTWGGSALGITQLFVAGTGADLQAQSILVAASTFYGQLAYQGGVWRKSLTEGWLTAQGAPHIIDLWKSHPTNSAFWQDHYDMTARAEHVTAPALHVSGWFDIFAQGTIDNFLSRQYQGATTAQGKQIMVMGPWPHGIMQKTGDLHLPDNYNFDIAALERRLYDQYLLGEHTGIEEDSPIHYYTLGDVDAPDAPGNEWRTADTWPPFATRNTPLYLSVDGSLEFSSDNRRDGVLTYVYDPADPVPTQGGQNLLLPAGPYDQHSLSHRDDVLVFMTPPLETPLEITGRVYATIFISSDAPDTDFTAKFVDVYPDGREILMLDSIQRVKFRNSYEQPEPLPPGEVDAVTIDLWSISLVINTGHRLGLHISSSNYPRFEVNPNTGDDFPDGDTLRAAVNNVHMSPAYPSALLLPVRPQGDGVE